MKHKIFFAADSGAPGGSDAQQKTQDAVNSNYSGYEARRKLSTATYAENTQVSIDIPRDTSVKRMQLQCTAAFTVTFSSGSPTMSPFGLLAKICPNFSIVADGSRNVKVLDLFMQRCMNALSYGGAPRRGYAKGASLQGVNDWPTTEWLSGAIAYPSTTQDIITNESVTIDFENPFAYERGKSVSQLYTRNLQTCQAIFGFGSLSNFQTDGVGATVTYSNVAITVTPTIIEDRFASLANGAFDYNEFVIRKTYSSQQTLAQIDMNAGNKITHFAVMARNGDTNTALSDLVLTDINVLTNGVNPIVTNRFRDLRNDNKSRYGVSDDQYASSLSILTGFALMSFIKAGDALSGLDTQLAKGVSTVQLQVSTNAGSGLNAATYTNPVQVSVLQGQLVPVPAKG